jgi:hypothetical protein
MKYERDEFPIRELFIQTGLPVEVRFDGFLDRARTGGKQEKFEFAYILHSLALLGRRLRPEIIPAEACQQGLHAALEIFKELGQQGHPTSCLMAAKSQAGGQGCNPDTAQARIWLGKAEKLGCGNPKAIANIHTLIALSEAALPNPAMGLHHQYDQ